VFPSQPHQVGTVKDLAMFPSSFPQVPLNCPVPVKNRAYPHLQGKHCQNKPENYNCHSQLFIFVGMGFFKVSREPQHIQPQEMWLVISPF